MIDPSSSSPTGFRETLAGADASMVGTFVTIPRVEIVEALAAAGFDFIILDCEHGPFGTEALIPLIAASRGAGLAPIVRVPDDRPQVIGGALDCGADGVLVPRATSLASAELAVRAMRLPPAGDRGVNPYIRAASYGLDGDFLQNENARRAAMLMIEDLRAVGEIERIAALLDLDCAFIGPFDLSAGKGMPGAVDHPAVLEIIDHVLETARSQRLSTGVFAATPEAASRWLERGVNLVALSTDSRLASHGFRDALGEVWSATSPTGGAGADGDGS